MEVERPELSVLKHKLQSFYINFLQLLDAPKDTVRTCVYDHELQLRVPKDVPVDSARMDLPCAVFFSKENGIEFYVDGMCIIQFK
jgi:hypothetical protein